MTLHSPEIPVHRLELLKQKSASPRKKNLESWLYSNTIIHPQDTSITLALVYVPELKQYGIYFRHSLIAVRLFPEYFTEKLKENRKTILEEEFVKIIAEHLELIKKHKTQWFDFVSKEAWRWIHGEADGIPGIVLDHYQTVLVIQSSCSAGEFCLPYVAKALKQNYPALPLYERSTGQVRRIEGLSERTRWIHQQGYASHVVETNLAGLKLSFVLPRAQKTGLFLDQRKNLQTFCELLQHLPAISPKTMLDCCCYAGAWASAAATQGCTHITLIDTDNEALSQAQKNILAHNANTEIQALHGDVFEHLSLLWQNNKQFLVVVADPPAFAKSQKHLANARVAYARLVKMASRLVAPQGIFVICSCSRYMEEGEFLDLVLKNLTGNNWVLLARGSQSPDHTLSQNHAHGEYLKCFFFTRNPML